MRHRRYTHLSASVLTLLLVLAVHLCSFSSALHIEPKLTCVEDTSTSDKESYVCSFKVQMSHQPEGEKEQEIATEAKQFVTTCPQPGACVYSHITLKHPLPIQQVEPQQQQKQNNNNKRSKPTRTVKVETSEGTKTATATTSTSSTSTVMSSTETSKTSSTTSKQQTQLSVGEAKYHPPYSQYGPGIEAVLHKHDSTTSQNKNDNVIPSWYIELGNAHLLNVQSTTNDKMGPWYHAELAINAYQQAKHVLERKQQQADPSAIPMHRELLATVHFQLGEAYASDVEFKHLEEARDNFVIAKNLFHQLRLLYTERSPPSKATTTALLYKARIPAMDKGYADVCIKLGMVLSNQAVSDSNAAIQMTTMQMGGGGDGMIGGVGGNNNINLLDGLGAGFGGGGGGGGGGLGDMLGGGGIQMDNIQELLTMLQSNQQEGAEAKVQMEVQLKEAAEYLDEAIMIYEQYLYHSDHNVQQRVMISGKDRHDWQTSLAMAYQQAATIAVSSGHLIRAREFMNQGLDLYLQHILPYQNSKLAGAGAVTTKTAVGGLYVSLADASLQLGDYDAAKQTYEQSMYYHRDNNLEIPPFATFADGDEGASQIDEAIQLYRQQLDEYRRMVKEGITGGGMYYMPQDDGYEADVISAIGSMHLSKGDLEGGMGMLEQAVKMYESVQDVKKNRRGLADVNINLAMAYFRARRFEQSRDCHFKALEIYKELYGQGVNPYTQGMEDIGEILEQAGLGDYAEQIKKMMGSQEDNDSNKVTVDIQKFKSSQKANVSATMEDESSINKKEEKAENSNQDKEEL